MNTIDPIPKAPSAIAPKIAKVEIEGTETNLKNNFSSGKTGFRKEDVEKMSEEEIIKLMDENPNFAENIIY